MDRTRFTQNGKVYTSRIARPDRADGPARGTARTANGTWAESAVEDLQVRGISQQRSVHDLDVRGTSTSAARAGALASKESFRDANAAGGLSLRAARPLVGEMRRDRWVYTDEMLPVRRRVSWRSTDVGPKISAT